MPTMTTPQTDNAALAEQAANLFLQAFGNHPGFRLAHAKGIVCEGTFEATSAARRIESCRAFQRQACPGDRAFFGCHRSAPDSRRRSELKSQRHRHSPSNCPAAASRTSSPTARTASPPEHRLISLVFLAVSWPLVRTVRNPLRSSNSSPRIPTRRDFFPRPTRNRPASPLTPISETIASFL